MATLGLLLILWSSTCYLVLKSRQRSLYWLSLAAAGPFGFIAISMLEDQSPAPDEPVSAVHPETDDVLARSAGDRYVRLGLVFCVRVRGSQARTDDQLRILHDRNVRHNDRRPTERIQRHVGVWRRVGRDLLGRPNLSALAHLLQSCRPTFQAASKSNTPRFEAFQWLTVRFLSSLWIDQLGDGHPCTAFAGRERRLDASRLVPLRDGSAQGAPRRRGGAEVISWSGTRLRQHQLESPRLRLQMRVSRDERCTSTAASPARSSPRASRGADRARSAAPYENAVP